MTIDERIGEQLRGWVDGGAAPVTIDELERPEAPLPGTDDRPAPSPARRRALVLVAAAIVVGLVSVAVLSARRDETPVVTDDVTPMARYHYLIEPADPSDASGPVEHAEYGGALHRGIVWTAQARLAAYGRTDATVVATASGTGAVVSTVEPLSDDEVSLLLGVQGELSLAVVGDPTELARCDDPPPAAAGPTTVARRAGGWPQWGPVLDCWSTFGQVTTYLGTTDEGDPNAIVLAGSGARVVETGDRFDVMADVSSMLSSSAGVLCGDDTGCTGRVAVALDGTVVQPGGVIVGPDGRVVAEDLSRVQAESLRSVLVAGGYPVAVTVTPLAPGTTSDTMRPWVEQPNGSAPAPPDDGGDGWSGPNTLTVQGWVTGGEAPGTPEPLAHHLIEIVDADGTRQATTDDQGEVELPVATGTVQVSVFRDGIGNVCRPITVVILGTGHHGVRLDCSIK